MKEVVIDGVTYVKAGEIGEGMSVVVVDSSGLTYVGLFDVENPGKIRNARCVIRWGTTGHLSELANKGPLENTKLGDVAPIVFIGGFSVAIPAPGWSKQ